MFETLVEETPRTTTPGAEDTRWVLGHIQEALRGLRFGEITVVVQDGVVVQVERTDKVRLSGRDRRR